MKTYKEMKLQLKLLNDTLSKLNRPVKLVSDIVNQMVHCEFALEMIRNGHLPFGYKQTKKFFVSIYLTPSGDTIVMSDNEVLIKALKIWLNYETEN